MAPSTIETPWFKSVWQDFQEWRHPKKLPPLELTSKPIDVPSVWGFYGGHEKTAGATSVLIHIAVLALILFLGTLKPVQKMLQQVTPLFAPPLKPFEPEHKGGGGGGARQPL
ncbi:MAG TPA: hypothetical protein VKS01_12870, partial [Bryobacteraceae bacterium]|nr:hypothetical protein [Bryobacteraceae bacterium]